MNPRGTAAVGILLAAAAAGSAAVQLAFAAIAVGVVGMAHGASDLAIVAPRRRASFLTFYALVAGACLWWWTMRPDLALPAFLAASAIHFGVEDAPDGTLAEQVARGAGLIAIPAVLHRTAFANLLDRAGGVAAAMPPWLIDGAALLGAGCAAALVALGIARRSARLLAGTGALLLLPPLIGFSAGFLILHALPQTQARRARMGCATMRAYLRATAPILLAAIAMAAIVGALLLHWGNGGTRALFAGIAALAVPHLLVTPWFERASLPSPPLKRPGWRRTARSAG